MDDFREATKLERIEEHVWQGNLYQDWALWGPAGGFLTAIALRAVGEATEFNRPVSLSCQFLSVAQFAPVQIAVKSIRAGKRSQAFAVEMHQQDRTILTTQIWVSDGDKTGEMMQHDYCATVGIPARSNLKTYLEIYPKRKLHPFMARMEQCPINPIPDGDLTPQEPETQSLFRWVGGLTSNDPFIDAGRMMMFMDTHAWLATYAAHPTNGPSPYIAPNLDYYYQFHRPTGEYDWVFMKNRADLAHDSLISTQGEIRSLAGDMLVRGYAQLLCSRRPQQFS